MAWAVWASPVLGADYLYTTNNGTLIITRYTGPGGAVTIPSGINGTPVTSIGEAAFIGCSNLTRITIPSGVTSVGNAAFRSCAGLTDVTLPNTLTTIGQWAFDACPQLISVTIPGSVTNIGRSPFDGDTKLMTINTDPRNRFYVSEDGVLFNKDKSTLLQYPGGKTGAYLIPNSVTNIANEAFHGCSSLTSISIPDSVIRIGDSAFEECSSLSRVAIPDGVASIGGEAFWGCTHLTTFTLPNSVTSIGDGVFSGCSRLTNVIISPRPQPIANPLVKEMLRAIRPFELVSLMRQITGEEPVLAGNEVVVFTNRLTESPRLRKATQFVFEQFAALGLQVQYQDWEKAWAGGPTHSDRNVVAIQPGVSRPGEIVVICAHFDDCSNTDRAPGADDNGSGSAAVLTAAKLFSQYHFERTIHYVLFTGEEQHGLGSQEYVAQAVAGGSNIVAVLAPDMIGYASSTLETPTCTLFTWGAPDLGLEGEVGAQIEARFALGSEIQEMFTSVVAFYGLSNTISCSFSQPGFWGVPSDAEFFFEHGYSTLLPTHAHDNSGIIHSAEDTLDTLNLSYFTAMVQAIVGTAAHLAYPTDRRAFEAIEVANSDWTPGSGVGGGRFYGRLAVGATETNVDLQDVPGSEVATNSPFQQELRIYSKPYGVPLQTDTRSSSTDTIFRAKLVAADATGAGISGNTRLRFSPLTPAGSNRVYLARVHIEGRYLATGKDFDCVTNLHEVISAGGFVELPSLAQVPDGTLYGTCEVSARLLNQDAANCRLRLASKDSQRIVLTATAQMGAPIMDALEVCTNLVPPLRWTLLKSFTDVVRPDAIRFESGWTEVVREVDASWLPKGPSHFFRLKRTWY